MVVYHATLRCLLLKVMTSITGHVVIVLAPMGSGKGTLIRHVQSLYPRIYTTVSCTTRQMRPGETQGKEYHFISSEEFDKKIQNAEFLEWAHFGLNRYGTLKSEIIPRLEKGEVVIAEIELQGVEQLQKILPREHLTTVYIDAGGWDTLKARAIARAPISDEELAKRYERYLIEITFKDAADVVIDNSQGMEKAKQQFADLFKNLYKV